ncbi:terminal repeat-encoded protein [Staphylococcus phage phiSA12]|uniref:Terminal repeat-encoded protein n=1 Tax=Staphylococcus phage phiSA12 TaxID=1450142 RepID=W0TXK9_9CAUD|nr:terminal repeat-encoded protein [Staphylococcus phage phiSA12]BAO47049.1 terminal repeat-encoded protein [Staphylococcus phage phiSA12]
MNTRRVNRALDEAVRLLDEQIADTQKTMQELNKQLEKQIKAKQELMVLVDVMNGDDE